MFRFLILVLGWSIVTHCFAQTALPLQRKADGLYRRDSFEAAAHAYGQALKLEPQNSTLLYNLGNAYYRQGKQDEAADAYRQALRSADVKPNLAADAWHNLGNIAYEQQDYAEAIDAYKQSLRLRPGDAETRKNLTLARKQLASQSAPPPPQHQQDKQQQEQQQESKSEPQEQEPQPNQSKLNRDEVQRALDLLEKEEQRVKRNLKKDNRQSNGAASKRKW